jgi:hypothetical protein
MTLKKNTGDQSADQIKPFASSRRIVWARTRPGSIY